MISFARNSSNGAAQSIPLSKAGLLGRWREAAPGRAASPADLAIAQERSARERVDRLVAAGRVSSAIDELYRLVEERLEAGAIARARLMLSSALELAPQEPALLRLAERLERAAAMEELRGRALAGARGSKMLAGGAARLLELEIERLWPALSVAPTLTALGGELVERLFSVVRYRRVAAGDLVAAEGERLAQLFLVAAGRVDLRARRPGGGEWNLLSVSPGETIGDRALFFARASWVADYRAVTEVAGFTLDREGLAAALVGSPDPTRFLSALRSGHDARVVALVDRLHAGFRSIEIEFVG